MAKAKTTAQIAIDISTGEMTRSGKFSFAKAREMRRDPTINLCRKYSVAPILAASWCAEGDPDQAEFLEAQFQPIRNALLRTALFCELDFGWKAYELVYGIADFTYKDGRVEKLDMIQRVKPLLNDITKARYDKETGDFIGLSTVDQFTGAKILIDADHVIFINFDDEGLGNYAEPAAQVAEGAYGDWKDANDAANKYDRKMAGTFLVCEYPVGETPYTKAGGAVTDNATIAEDALKALTSSGQMAIPKDFKDIDPNLPPELNSWKFYFLEPQARQGGFVERQKYIDAQKTRAYALPERSIIEGEFGTKAEAEAHGNVALLIRQMHHEDITELLNLGPVNLLLKTNWGTASTAWLKAVPLTENQKAAFAKMFDTLVASPISGPDILEKINMDAVLDGAGIPIIAEDDPEATAEPVAVQGGGDQVILNGAQISSAVELLNQVSAKLMPTVVALELLKGLGIPDHICERMAQAAASFKVPLAVVSPQAAAQAVPKVTVSASMGRDRVLTLGGPGSGPHPGGGGGGSSSGSSGHGESDSHHGAAAAASKASAHAHATAKAANPQGRNASSEQHGQAAKAYRAAQKAHLDAAAAHEKVGTKQAKATASTHKYNAQQAKKAAVTEEHLAKAKKAAGR